jgi:hypothetical protein
VARGADLTVDLETSAETGLGVSIC